MHNKNKITLLNIASTIILQGLAFFSGPIFSSALGTSNYGIAAVYLTWVQIASIVFSLQAGGAIGVARIDYPVEEQKRYQSSVLSLATVSFICLSILVVLFALVTQNSLKLNVAVITLGLAQAWGMYCVTFMNAKYTYEFKAGRNLILSASASALTILFSIILIRGFSAENNYWGRIIGQSAVYVVFGVFLYINMFRAGQTFFDKEFWMFTLPITIPTIFHSLAHIVLNQSDKVMIQGMMGNSPAGVYALASTFSAVMNAVWHALNNTWAPFYYEYTKHGRIDEMKKHAKNYIELFSVICIGFLLLSREVFHLYAADKAFWVGTDYVPLLAIGYYFVFMYSFPVNFEFYNKKTKSIAIGTISAAAINIIFNYLMINWIGGLGAVIATVISHAFLFLFHYLNSKRIKDMKFPFTLNDFALGLLSVIVACLISFLLKDLWLIRWGFSGVLGVYIIAKILKRREIF